MDKLPELFAQSTPLDVTLQVVAACQDAKGTDVTALDVADVMDLADYFVIVSGRSDRHVQGICNKIISQMAQRGLTPSAVEGFDEGHWVLMDFDDVVVHVFYEPTREHYDIEGLWMRAKQVNLEALAKQAEKARQAA